MCVIQPAWAATSVIVLWKLCSCQTHVPAASPEMIRDEKARLLRVLVNKPHPVFLSQGMMSSPHSPMFDSRGNKGLKGLVDYPLDFVLFNSTLYLTCPAIKAAPKKEGTETDRHTHNIVSSSIIIHSRNMTESKIREENVVVAP